MAFTFSGSRGTGESKTTGTTVDVTPSTTIAAGQLVIVTFAGDNMETTEGATTDVSVSDTQSNTYTRLFEYTRTDGSPNDGVTVAVFWSILDTAIDTGDTVTVTHNNVVSRSAGLEEFNTGGTGVNVVDSDSSLSNGDSPSVAVSGMSSAEYLLIGGIGVEGSSNDSLTQDSDYSNLTQHGNHTGGPVSNTYFTGGYRIATLTSDTYAPTLGSSRDYAAILFALEETGGSTQVNKDMQVVYDIDVLVNKDLEADYDILNLVNKDLEADYDILNLVNKDTQLIWDMAELVNKDMQLVYDMSGSVNKDMQAIYDILNLVNKDLEADYDIFNSVNKDTQLIWDMTELVNKDMQIVYDMSGIVNKDLEAVYDINVLVNKDLEADWDMFNLVNKDLEADWDMAELVNKDMQAVYDILAGAGTVNKDMELIYDINGEPTSNKEDGGEIISETFMM